MAEYVDRQGNVVKDVSPADAEALVRRGELAIRGAVELLDPETNEVRRFGSAEEAKDALSRGFRIAGATEVRAADLERRFGGAGDVAAAFATGVADAATMGAVSAGARRIARDTGEESDLLSRQEAMPGATTAGNVAAFLLPGGVAGSGAKAARLGGAALTRGLATRGAGMARRLAARGIEEGVEGAASGGLFEAQRAISEAAIENKELTAEQVMARVGVGSALGLAGGLAFGAGTKLAGEGLAGVGAGARRLTAESADALKQLWRSRRGTALTDKAASMYADVIRRTRGDAAGELVERGLRGDTKIVRALEHGDTFAAESAPRLRSLLDESEAIGRQTREFSAGSLKRGQVLKNVRELDDAVVGEARRVIGRLDELADEMDARPAVFGTAGAAKKTLRDSFAEYGMAIEKGLEKGGREGAADVFMALDNAKRKVGNLRVKASRSDGFVQETFENLYEEFRQTLEKSDLFGDAAGVQRDVNKSLSQYLANRRVFSRSFLKDSGLQEGFDKVLTADPNAIARYLDQVGTGSNQLTDEVFRRHVELQSELFEKMAQHYDLPPELAGSIGKSRESVAGLRRALDEAEDIVATRNQLRELDKGEDALGGALGVAAGAVGTVGGALLGGFPGAFVGGGLANAAALGGRAISKPGAVVRGVVNMRRLADQFDAKALQAVQRYVKAVTKAGGQGGAAIVKAGAKAGRGAHRFGSKASSLGSVAAFEETVERVSTLAQNPGEVAERVSRNVGDDAGHSPQMAAHMTATSQRAVSFLESKIPSLALRRRDMLQPNLKKAMRVPDSEIRRFMNYARAVEDPLSMLKDMEQGRLTRESVEAVKAVYPQVYERVVAQVHQDIAGAKRTVKYEARLQLGILLGTPTDPTLEPRYISRVQSSYSSDPAQQGPGPQTPQQTPAASRLKGIAEQAGSNLSEQDRLALRRA